ncbi:hypothetical protein RRG08_001669 [Elysia crispata]|uniref:Uncharacterized protein n=1 Tax=Elysia crispata TaxID=231223 RepID=A0AAE1AK33_9GAST|nr:hypothetical protein RRG08_001669 [Elysia crispata]
MEELGKRLSSGPAGQTPVTRDGSPALGLGAATDHVPLNLSRGGRGLQAIVTARPVREKHWTIIVGGTLLGPSHARETLDNYCGWDLARTQPCARNTGQLLWVGPCSDPAMREKHWTIIVGGTLLGPSHARETLDNYCGWDLARTQPCARNTGQLLWVGPCSDPAMREKHWTIIVGGTLLGPSHARETLDNYCGWDLARTQPCARNTGQLLWVGPCSDPAMREKHWTIIVGGTFARTQPCARNTGQLLWVGPCSDPAMREKHWTIIVGGTLLGPSHARETLDNYCGWDLARTQPCARNTGQLLWVGPCSDPAMREKHWTIIVGGTLLGPSHARETLDNYCGWDLARTQPCARIVFDQSCNYLQNFLPRKRFQRTGYPDKALVVPQSLSYRVLVLTSTQIRRWLYHKACPIGCWCSLVPGPGAGCTTKLVLPDAGAH